ncbi:phosphoketolase [Arthrobacter agilis]|nr:phosphoketolase [Arthrobacter agilis]
MSTLDIQRLDAWWRAANYVSVGQIYLRDNALLTRPLAGEDVKARLLGHWGTTPGLNFVYTHLNRVIAERGQEMLFVTGPGHGGPAVVAQAWLEGTYSEVYSGIGQDGAGLNALFKQFSYPGGIPSHAAPESPGSIHEGGELGYVLAHAYGAVFDNPGLIAPPPWWVTVRRRPDRWPRAGIRTASWTRRSTAPSCRSCTSTATRSPTRPSSPACPRSSCGS